MRTRSITTYVAFAALALTACGGGGGGSKALSEDDFNDALTDVCDGASRRLDKLDFPTDGDFGDFADDAAKIFENTIEDAKAIRPPDDLADDYDDFIANLEDQLDLTDDLGKAKDEDAALKVLDKLGKLSDEQSGIAQDLDVEACDPSADGGDTTDTTDSSAADTTPATAASTVPPTTAAPITLPPTVPQTLPPATLPPATQPPASGDPWTVVDLTTIFNPPTGFYLKATTPTDGTLDAVRALPELNNDLLEFGVATLVDASDDTEIADIWIGVSRDDTMPADWKTLDCPDGGDLRTSTDGIPGIVCYGAADSPTWEIFTATVGDYGISVYTLVPDVPGDLVADAFLEANPG
jgi:hypothetical protein